MPPHARRSAFASILLLVLVATSGTLRAHEGHDHGTAPEPVAAALPRTEAHGDLFEVVAILQPGGALLLTLDRYAENAPLDGSIALGIDGEDVAVSRQGIGLFVARHRLLEQPGRRDLVFTVTAGDDMDLLAATLTIPPQAPAASASAGWRALLHSGASQAGLGAMLFILGAMLGRATVRRPLPPMVEDKSSSPAGRAGQVGGLALATLLLAGSAAAQQPPFASEAPRRMQDGAIFVPKPSQRLLGIRTTIAEDSEVSAAIRMVGTLVPDPNASGRLQASQKGRLEPGDAGFPVLGQRVARGEALAYVTPAYSAAERGGLIQNAAELDAQIAILEARVRRLTALRGTVAEREIADARAELAGARQRRTAIQPALSGREALVAPVSGVVSAVRGAVGQLVESTATVVEIVDPTRLWVEALAFDRTPLADVVAANATLPDGRVLDLAFVGRGLTVRQQAIPMNFRVDDPPPDAPIGTSVLVTLRTRSAVRGIVIPADAVVRGAEGPAVVFEHAAAERFLPRQVRVQPLDGTRVVVTAGLEPGRRIVVHGAALVAQIR